MQDYFRQRVTGMIFLDSVTEYIDTMMRYNNWYSNGLGIESPMRYASFSFPALVSSSTAEFQPINIGFYSGYSAPRRSIRVAYP